MSHSFRAIQLRSTSREEAGNERGSHLSVPGGLATLATSSQRRLTYPLSYKAGESNPSARSGDIFGDGQMLVVRTPECRADSLGQFVGTEHSIGLYNLALAVDPLGLYRIEPRTLLWQ